MRVSSCHGFGFWTRTGEKCLETTVNMAPPEISAFVWSADEETDTVSVSFDMAGSHLCRVFFSAGEEAPAQIEELTRGQLELRFGEGERFAIVVYLKTPDAVHPMAIEYKADATTSKVDLSDGEGYISTNGSVWENVEETQECNLCIKAYAGK